ncbi:MAG TPA: PPOX class F420-dependent oxidoreductase [Solirubrobacteraceae bacterium]|jgi:PPOX class probable F420-dependent enzyme|nr:PPOX class F420-dependent oxidoreductase [Solirubrobacteraceae bacterium]
MTPLTPELRDLVSSGPLAHLSTINANGSPQVTVIWIGLDGEDIVSAHMARNLKVRNVERDPRVVLSFTAPGTPGIFLNPYAALRATATITEGGAWDLLNRLAKVYMAPDAEFPAPKREGGFIIRYAVERVSGVGPWASR